MPRLFKPFCLFLALLLASPLLAAPRQVKVVDLEVDENGGLILPVSLGDGKGGWRTFRFLLDSGAGYTLIDKDVPEDFWNDLPEVGNAQAVDANATARSYPMVMVKSVDAGGLRRDEILALRAPLKETLFGRVQDHPVDGILGMTFLRQTRFLLDAPQRKLSWFATLPYPEVIRLSYRADGVPFVPLQANGQTFAASVDTGCLGMSGLPARCLPQGTPRRPRISGGANSMEVAESAVAETSALGRSFGTRLMSAERGETGVLGLEVLAAAPVFLDFCVDFIAPAPAAPGRWATRLADEPRSALLWERKGGAAVLTVGRILPGDALESAGLKTGDRIVKVADLEGAKLDRRGVLQLLREGVPSVWKVEREGKLLVLRVGGGKG